MKSDAKQQVGGAGIESNICYYEALESKYKSLYQNALEQKEYWKSELEKLKPTKNKKTSTRE